MKFLIQALACIFVGLLCRAGELQRAAAQGDVEKVRVLLEAAPNSVSVRDGATTALHEAARGGHLKVVELLVARGADVNAADFSGLTPLKLALGYRRAEVAAFLREKGGLEQIPVRPSPTGTNLLANRASLTTTITNNVTTNRTATSPATASVSTNPVSVAAAPVPEPTPTNRPVPIERVMQVIYPIHEAARLGDLEQIQFLFKTTPDLIDSTDDKKLTALHFAAANRQLAAARLLLGFHATVDSRSSSGQTPLHLATKNGDLAIAQLLLTNGADVNARDSYANTPLLFAAQAGESEELQAAIIAGERFGRDISQKRATMAALYRQQLDVVQLLLSQRADVNARNRSGATALMQAVRLGNEAVVQALLNAGANPNIEDSTTRSTPLHLAAGRGQTSIAELLIQRQAAINAVDSRGDTPLCYALREGHQPVIAALRRAGGNIGQMRPLTAAEQSLIEFYQKSETVLQNGSASAKANTLLSMNPTKRDLDKMFPNHSAGAWKVVEELNRQIKEAFRKPVNDAERGKEIWRIRPEPPSLLAQEWLNRRWLALPVISLVVDKTGSTSRPGDYCYVNNHWVLVPPLRSIEAMQVSNATRSGQ